MPSTILSDNGVSSGSAGLKTTAASDGSLALQTTTAAGAATTAVTIDTSQNVGLGVTPSAWQSGFRAVQLSGLASWNVDGSTAGSGVYFGNNVYRDATDSRWEYIATGDNATQYLQASGQHIWRTSASGTAGNAISFTQAMTLNASGTLLLNTTSASTYGGAGSVVLNNASAVDVEFNIANTLTGYIYAQSSNMQIGTQTSIPLLFQTANAERARIDSSGNLLVGCTSFPGAGTSTTGAAFGPSSVSVQRAAATACYFGRSNDGEVVALYSGTTQRGTISISGATTTYGSVSDYRLKENIAPITDGLAKVMTLKPSTFNFIEFPEQTINGFIAHEVAEVEAIAVVGEKDAVNEEGNPLYQSVDAAKLVPLLTAAIQEQQAIIETLKARLDAANL